MPVLEFGILIEYSISKDPDEPAHPHSLARAFAARINIARTYMQMKAQTNIYTKTKF